MNVRAMLLSGVLATGLGGFLTQGAFARHARVNADEHRPQVQVDRHEVVVRDNHDRDDHFRDRDDRYVQVDRFDHHNFYRDDHRVRFDHDRR